MSEARDSPRPGMRNRPSPLSCSVATVESGPDSSATGACWFEQELTSDASSRMRDAGPAREEEEGAMTVLEKLALLGWQTFGKADFTLVRSMPRSGVANEKPQP